jgi:hypothetical protein
VQRIISQTLSISAETLSRQRFDEQKNSQAVAALPPLFAVLAKRDDAYKIMQEFIPSMISLYAHFVKNSN